ncbi:MAG: hypothetical protein IJI25_00130 [Eubacterium sp.]|nr:hypothetical protein [Eubacterium sp.]
MKALTPEAVGKERQMRISFDLDEVLFVFILMTRISLLIMAEPTGSGY